MKLSRMLVPAIAALSLAPCAHAEQHGTAYAAVKAIVDYCGRVDDDHRKQYDALGAKALASLAGAGGSADYQAVYEAVTTELRKMPTQQGRAQCAIGIGYHAIKSHEHGR